MNTRFIRSALTLFGTIWSMSVTAAIHYVDANSTNATPTVTIVPGTADPWLAGMPDGSAASGGDAAPKESPVLVSGFVLIPGSSVWFTVFGGVAYEAGRQLAPPDGSDGIGQHSAGAENGISALTAPWESLVGVFLGSAQPSLSPAPPGLDFSTPASRDYLVLSPALQQVFFIGDGLTSAGIPQEIIVPPGATRLFLGSFDGYGWFNNIGRLWVEVRSEPEPVARAVRYVNGDNVNSTSPYTNWATAATTIQDAIDVAVPGDEVVVTNGVYETGGRAVYPGMTNRVAVTKPLTVRSVNGPEVTVIRGYQIPRTTNGVGAVRCVYLTIGASLVGFTLTNGAVNTGSAHEVGSGGGVWCESANATVSNCVLIGNSAEWGGGAFWGTLDGCRLSFNTASTGGGAVRSILNRCVLTNNSARQGGAAFNAALNQCIIANNTAELGGGVSQCQLDRCSVSGNTASQGGGAISSSLTNCLLTDNIAQTGGGAWGSFLWNCTIVRNAASLQGGGVWSVTGIKGPGPPLFGCDGAGCYPNPECHMAGCHGGLSLVANCILYDNTAPSGANYDGFTGSGSNFFGGSLNYSCTFPMPTNNVGNITNAPLFVDVGAGNFRLQSTSPCINAGRNADAPTGLDLDGNPRIIGGTVDIGAYEFQPSVRYVNLNSATPAPPYTNWATAAKVIQDALDVALPGDEVVVTNGVYETGGRAVYEGMTNRLAVTKPLSVRSVNGPSVTLIRGYQVPGTTNGGGAVRCVYLTNGATLSGFTITGGAVMGRVPLDSSGLPAFTLPLSGHELLSGGGVWCESFTAVVSNCALVGNAAVYGGGAFGGTLNRCQVIENIAGAGGGVVRSSLNDCMLMGNSASLGRGTHYYGRLGGGAYLATLNRCLVSSNSAENGGGVSGCILTACTISGNTATEAGGGVLSGTLYNCVLAGNAAALGGGAYGGVINNGTITGNAAASQGGGVWAYNTSGGGFRGCDTIGCFPQPECLGCVGDDGIVNNSIIYENTAPEGPNHFGFTGIGYDTLFGPQGGRLDYSCTMPLPTNGLGNITNAPLFMDAASGNFRLQFNSPCINAGRNADAPVGLDLDGNPRIAGGTVDIGAYEFQSPQSTLSYAWLRQYGLPTDGSADLNDPDQDGQSNWQEWRAWTNPTNSASTLRLVTPLISTNALLVRWQSVQGQTYLLERGTSLRTPSTFQTIATNIVGQAGTTTYTDTNAVGVGPFFYRVRVNPNFEDPSPGAL